MLCLACTINHPGVQPGTFLFRHDPFMTACDQVSIEITGGGHAARPHMSVDPVAVTASVVMALQTIGARNVDPAQAAVVTVGSMHACIVNNVIPQRALLELSVRSFNPQVRDLLKRRIRELVETQAASYGAIAKVDYQEGYPVVVNSDAETDFAIQVARELVGDDKVVPQTDLLMGSEDFAFMLQHRLGTLLRIGNGAGEDGCRSTTRAMISTTRTCRWARLVERYLAQ